MKANTRNQEFQDDKVAAIGIGAMIVFIALILVAAVAAAVIIQTAEALQQNAQQTGDDTADNMAGKVMINAAYVDGNTGYKLYVRLAPGSEPAPTNSITYQLMCPGTLPVEGAVGNVVLMDGTGGAVATLDRLHNDHLRYGCWRPRLYRCHRWRRQHSPSLHPRRLGRNHL